MACTSAGQSSLSTPRMPAEKLSCGRRVESRRARSRESGDSEKTSRNKSGSQQTSPSIAAALNFGGGLFELASPDLHDPEVHVVHEAEVQEDLGSAQVRAGHMTTGQSVET